MSKSILIVQEGDRSMDALAHHVGDAGYGVSFARDFLEAKEKFEKNKPDLVVVSAIISGGSTCDLCRYIRMRTPGERLPIIVTSPIVTGTLQLEAKTRWGADEFIVLPAPINILMKTVRFHLGETVDRPKTELFFQAALKRANKSTTQIKIKHKKIPAEGNIAQVGLERLLIVLGAGKRSGEIEIENHGELFVLGGADGKLVKVVTPFMPEMSLGKILVRDRAIDETMLIHMQNRMQNEKTQLGQMLLKAGLMKKDPIIQALVQQFLEKSLFLFKFKKGVYRFRKSRMEPAKDFPARLPIGRLVLEKNRRQFKFDEFDRRYAKQMKQSVHIREGGPFAIQELDLAHELKRVIFAIDGKKSLRQLLIESEARSEDVKALIHTLTRLKLIGFSTA